MSPMPDSASANLQPTFADLQRQLAEARAERDEAQRRLVERTTERDESEAQKAAMAEMLQVINSSRGDLVRVFDAMLEKAMRLCQAEFGLLTNFDGEAFHAAALRGVPAVFAESWREPRRPSPGLALHRLTQGENLVHIPDVTAEDAYRSGDPIRRALADLGGAAKTRRFGCRGRREERNIGGPGGAHRTDRTAVNTGAVNASIEPPVIDWISRQARPIAFRKVQRHGHDNTHPHSQA